MKRIGILSDTHGYWDDDYATYLQSCDEIWHAGDIGSREVAERLNEIAPLRAVYGNIDDGDIRQIYNKQECWQCEDVKVYMTHIGGYPGRYAPGIQNILRDEQPQLFVCGHSHILKVMYDDRLNLLHINPGAAGIFGFHLQRTMIRLTIDGNKMQDCEVITLKDFNENKFININK